MRHNSNLLIFGLLLVFSRIKCNDIDDTDEVTIETIQDLPTIDVPYESPQPIDPTKIYLAEHFDDLERFEKRWIKSQAKKDGLNDDDIAKYDGIWQLEVPQRDNLFGDKGLVLKSKAKHAAISSSLDKPFIFDKKPLIVQYEVIFQDGQECGGAYLKLLTQTKENNLNNFHDKTPYTIMFGPDKCGNDHKLHFIFKHRNPLNGSIEEKHCKKPKERIDEIFTDKLPHLFTLILQPDNTFEIKIDNKLINSGNLLDDFTPPVNPPKEIDDPNDKKPVDWDEREKIPDPDSIKPDDWNEDAPPQIIDETATIPDGWLENEPTHIPDINAIKPNDWDSEMDGEWEPPLIDNPKCKDAVGCGPWEPPLINNPEYKGKWRPSLIDNPNYKGKWRPRRIPNPEYFEDKEPFKMQPVSAIGFELWSMSKDILFDNIIITEEITVAENWAAATFEKKRQKIARDSESVIQKVAALTNEYPFLWAVYIVVLGIPVVFVLYLCCKPSSTSASQPSQTQEQEEDHQTADKKKTDEPTEDVVEDEEKLVNNVEEVEDNREKDSGPDTDDDDEDDENEKSGEENPAKASVGAAGDGTRKRKVRKE